MKDVTPDLVAATDIPGFFGHRPLYIIEPDTIQVVKQSATRPELLTIYGPDRLYWVNVYEIENENKFEARLKTTQDDPSSVLCYWLPWRADGIVRIRLKVSGKYGQDLTDAHMQAVKASNSAIMPGPNTGAAIHRVPVDRSVGGDPRLFFTGMMDGCSTWIAGDPSQPVVYHINRVSFPVTVKQKDVYKKESKEHDIKTARMTRDFKELQSTEKAKNQGGSVGVTPDTHHMHHPYSDAGYQAKWRNQMAFDTGVGGNVRVARQYTSTFGVKHDSIWNFYAQDIYEYKDTDASGNTNPLAPTLYTAGMPHKRYP